MGASEWIAFAGLIFVIACGGASVIVFQNKNKSEILDKLQKNKDDLEDDLNAIRMSSFEEYKVLRKEMQESAKAASKEFGETIRAIREKITQVELFIRDQLQETRHTLGGRIEMYWVKSDQQHEELEKRTRQLELFQAHEMGKRESARSPN